ncbi:MAG: response regulator transcription factor [Candidatus Omnitrophica bacterium]|jgi:two-component system alkaline phosphatase synthesis response regulator PhoP|nr:response regulator transcription factor [Candidatus Omnitrophota bacterium]
MSKKTILVIEDEKNIQELLRFNLEEEGYRVLCASTGDRGLETASREKPDLIVLDVMLPGVSGTDILKAIRANSKIANTPVLMLTARSQESDKVLGLELGADDYVTKPFSTRELAARVKALFRRVGAQTEPSNQLKAGALEMDCEKHEVTIKGKSVDLTHKEFKLLRILLEARGRLLSRDQLLDRVWGYTAAEQIETRTVDMHIGQLRKKLKDEADRIITIKNEGYRLDAE